MINRWKIGRLLRRLKSEDWLPVLPLISSVVVLFGPGALAGKALFWGTPALQFIPWWSWAWQTISDGYLPLWNPLSGMGAPMLANYQTGLFYPPNWSGFFFYILGGSSGLAWWQTFLVAFHLIWAGLGMVRLAKKIGLGKHAQSMAGLTFGLSGYLVARAGFYSINAAVSWLPWVILYLTPEEEREIISKRRWTGLAGCLAMQWLAGHAQTSWYTLLLGVGWVGYWGLTAHSHSLGFKDIINRLWHSCKVLIFGSIIAAGAAAVQLLPTVEYLLQSQRAGEVDYELAMTYSFWPWRLLTLVAPDLFGNPANGNYWGYANYWEDALYIGLLPLLLAISGLLTRRSKVEEKIVQNSSSAGLAQGLKRPLSNFLLIIIGVAVLWGLGKNTPVFPWLYENFPTFDLFQAPTRVMIWAEFSLALLAAIGVEFWRRPRDRGLYWTRLGIAGACAVGVGSGLAWFTMGDVSPTFIQAIAIAGFWGIGAGILSLASPASNTISAVDNTHNKIWKWGVALFVCADLVLAGRDLNPWVEASFYTASTEGDKLRQLTKGHRLYLPPEDENTLKFERFFRFDSFDPGEDWINLRKVFLPNLTLLDGIPSSNIFDPIQIGRFTRWMEFLPNTSAKLHENWLDLMDVYAYERIDPLGQNGVSFQFREGSRRFRFVPCPVIVLTAEEAWQRVQTEANFDLSVILESEKGLPVETLPCPSDRVNWSGKAVIELFETGNPNQIDISIISPDPGWLVVSDVWYPGWQAWVDEERTALFKANYLFQALKIPAGEHAIKLIYIPISFWAGATISLGTLVGLTIFWIVRKKRHD